MPCCARRAALIILAIPEARRSRLGRTGGPFDVPGAFAVAFTASSTRAPGPGRHRRSTACSPPDPARDRGRDRRNRARAYGRYGRWFDAATADRPHLPVEYVARLWSVAEDRGAGSAGRGGCASSVSAVGADRPRRRRRHPRSVRRAQSGDAAAVRLLRSSPTWPSSAGCAGAAPGQQSLWLRRYELGLDAGAGHRGSSSADLALLARGRLQPDKFGKHPARLVVGGRDADDDRLWPMSIRSGSAARSPPPCSAIAGVGLIALPAGIMAGAMQEAMRRDPDARERHKPWRSRCTASASSNWPAWRRRRSRR